MISDVRLPGGIPHPDFIKRPARSRPVVTGLAGAALGVVVLCAGIAGLRGDWRNYQQDKSCDETPADVHA